MPKKRGGAGRPYKPKPGPKIKPVNDVFISNALMNDYVKELLEPTAFYYQYLSLPQQTKDLFIASLKSTLFKVGDKKLADPKLIFLGEYGDVRGVNLTFNFENLVKNPKKYLSNLPKDYIKQVLQQADIEREVERQVALELLATGVSKSPHFVALANSGGQVNLLENRNITVPDGKGGTKLVIVEGGQGLEGIERYKDLSSTAIDFVNNAQVFQVRAGGEKGFTDKSHYLLAEEAVYAGSPGEEWLKYVNGKDPINRKNEIDANAFKIRQFINDPLTPADIKQTFTKFLDDPDFQKTVAGGSFASSAGKKLSVENVLNITSFDPTHTDFYKTGIMLDDIVGGKVGGSSAFKDFVEGEIAKNYSQWGFSSQQAVLDLYKNYATSGLKFGDVGSMADPVFSAFSKSGVGVHTYQDSALFKNMMQDFVSNADSARGIIRDSIESKLLTMGTNFIDAYVDALKLPASVIDVDAYKDKVKKRLKGVHNWKSYIHIRSDMEAQEEFFEALNKGKLWEIYFFSSDYNKYLPAFIQDINNKVLTAKLINYNGTKLSIREVLNDLAKRKNTVLSNVGFIGGASEKRTFFNLQNRASLTPADFAIQNNEKLALELVSGGPKIEGGAFSLDALHKDVKTARQNFNTQFGVLRSGDITVFAKDLGFAEDLFEAFKDLKANYLTTLGSVREIQDLDVLFLALKNRTVTFDTAFAALKATDPAKFASVQSALTKYFKYVDAKGINTNEMASFGVVILNKFTKNGKLLKYTSLLGGLAERLSSVQNYAFAFLGDKVLANTIFKIPKIGDAAKWFWDNTYNPRYGSIQTALRIKNFFAGNAVGKGFAKFFASKFGIALKLGLSKLLPAFLTTATAGMAYLAMIVERVARGFMWSIWHTFRGQFGRILQDYTGIINDLILSPVKIVTKIFIRFFIALCFVVAFILVMVMSAFTQTGRPEGIGFYNDNLPTYTDADGNTCKELSELNPGMRLDASNFSGNMVIQGTGITSCPGWRGSDFHFGVDYLYPTGTSVVSPLKEDARVVAAGWDTYGFGNYVKIVQNIDGVNHYLIFAHLDSIDVSVGDTVSSGQLLGYSDSTGNSTGPHLHFEIRTGNGTIGEAENPCSIINCGCPSVPEFAGGVCNIP